MKILSIDTSSDICSVAVLENDTCIDEISINDGKTHSENLMPIVEKILKENNIKLNEIELISVVVGPGSFTGIRIGVASIKAIAEVLSIPIVSVTSLEGLAYNIDFPNENNICALIDARNNQVYAGIFDSNYHPLEEYMADDINNVLEKIKKYKNIIFVGDAAKLYEKLIKKEIENPIFTEDSKSLQSAKSVGKAGYEKYKLGIIESADTVIPKYLRKSQAERMKSIISISKMTKNDLDEISEILQIDFDDFWNENIFRQELENENSEYIVARINNEIVGFGGIWISPVDIHITNIVTKKNKRNMGIGTKILEALIELAKSKNLSELTLEVNEKNEIAQKLYRKYGFKTLGKRKKYYNHEDDALIMTLELFK